MPVGLELGDLGRLVLGHDLGQHALGGYARRERDGLGRAAVVAGDHEDADVHLGQAANRLGGVGLERVGHRDHAGEDAAVDAHEHDRLAVVLERRDLVLVRRDVDALAGHQLAVAEGDALAHDRAFDTVSRDRREALDRRQVDAVVLGAGDDRLGQRVLGVALERRRQREHPGCVVTVDEHDVGDLGLAVGQRAGLVEDDRRDLVGGLERVTGLDEDAVLGASAGADHDRGRVLPAQGHRGRR